MKLAPACASGSIGSRKGWRGRRGVTHQKNLSSDFSPQHAHSSCLGPLDLSSCRSAPFPPPRSFMGPRAQSHPSGKAMRSPSGPPTTVPWQHCWPPGAWGRSRGGSGSQGPSHHDPAQLLCRRFPHSSPDVARPDKISGADINSICQEVNAGGHGTGHLDAPGHDIWVLCVL